MSGAFVVDLGHDDAIYFADGENRTCRFLSGWRNDGRFRRRTASHMIEIDQKHTEQLVGVVVFARDELIQRSVAGAERAIMGGLVNGLSASNWRVAEFIRHGSHA